MSEDIEDFEREERAFAEALRKDAPVESFRPLDAGAIRAAARPERSRRTPWLRGMAAAAALVVAVGIGAALLPHVGVGSPTSVPAEPAGGYAAGGAVPEAASDRVSTAGYPDKANALAEWNTVARSPLSPRVSASGGWLDGKFYIVGGRGLEADCQPSTRFCPQGSNNLLDGASYDPAADAWQVLPDSPRPVGTEAPVVVGNRLYYSDSQVDSPVAPLVFDTATNAWQSLPPPAQGGQLVAAGTRLVSLGHAGTDTSADQILDPVTNTWSDLPTASFGDYSWRRGVWAGGLLIVGASGPTRSNDPYARFEALDLSTNTWHDLAQPKIVGAAGTLVGDYVVINDYTQAELNGKKYNEGARYNLVTRTWSDLPAPPSTVRTLPDGYGQVVGNRILIKSQLFDPADGSWTPLTSPNPDVLYGITVVGSPGGLLAFGGEDHNTLTGETYYLPAP